MAEECIKKTELSISGMSCAACAATIEKTTLKIGGMTCATCAKTIEIALKKLNGIHSVNVNAGAEKVYITYNSAMTTLAEMKKTIEDAGYQYFGVDTEETEYLEEAAREKDLKQKRNRVIAGLAVG
ncbi:MAG TPA: heavy metal translocating P-type ATPase, partial [Phycisphaerales bacterium]|nr:heavy metal translocating P-type ATPase [Phycisphaerales bacterium]